jgi:hypothetical protein
MIFGTTRLTASVVWFFGGENDSQSECRVEHISRVLGWLANSSHWDLSSDVDICLECE